MDPRANFRNIILQVLAVSLVSAVTLPTHAQSAKRSSNTASAPVSDKLDVTDLEKKYWAAKDTDFSVVQNRLYTKEKRFSLSTSYGFLVNDLYANGPSYSLSVNYYFSERYGMELNYTKTASIDNNAVQAFQRDQGSKPDYGMIKGYYGASFNWVPFYAKMSFLGSKILYFDMSFSPGLGITSYEQQIQSGNKVSTAPTLTLDVTQQFFMNKNFAVRLDYKNRWFQEDVLEYYANSFTEAGKKLRTDLNHTSMLMFGFTYYH